MQISRPVIQRRHENQFPKSFAGTGKRKKKKELSFVSANMCDSNAPVIIILF
jgi:hypothetical protein